MSEPFGSSEYVNTFRFIHSSDLQLGMTRKFLRSEAQSRFDDARLRAVERLGQVATEHDAACIVIAGDVFEHNALERETLGRALEVLKRLPVPVYLLPGNHDPLVADSIFHATNGLENVHVLNSFDPVEVVPGVELVGAPLKARYASEDLCARAVRDLEPTDTIRVLVGHGQVDGYGKEQAEALIDLDLLEEKLASGVIDYVALGDTHSTQSLGASGRVWFSGSPETTDFHDFAIGGPGGGGEVDSGNALVVEIAKSSAENCTVNVEPVATGAWTFEALDWEVSEEGDVEKIVEQLERYEHKDRTAVKYSVRGTLGLAAMATFEQAIGRLEPVFAALYERERLMSLHLAPSDDELENLPLSGYAAEAMRELISQTSAQDDAIGSATARDAVNLLFRFSKEVS